MSVQYYTLPERWNNMTPNQLRQLEAIGTEAREGAALVTIGYTAQDFVKGLRTIRVERPAIEIKLLTAGSV